jgi:hypothetical protein
MRMHADSSSLGASARGGKMSVVSDVCVLYVSIQCRYDVLPHHHYDLLPGLVFSIGVSRG